ncbi:MAG: DnaJ domain-containing protein [Desulfamplus sp.]|nr:DnaJ domain-containing protein [Desulfamplus sp.]
MTTYHKILLGLIAAAYLISPVDIIPDFFIPYLGWLDDTAVIGAIFYYIKHGKLPDFLYKKRKKTSDSKFHNFQYNSNKKSTEQNRYSRQSNQQNSPNKQPNQQSSSNEQSKQQNSSAKRSAQQNSSTKKTEEQDRLNNKKSGKDEFKREENLRDTSKSPYQILGISPKASKEEIQAAYRSAVKQYHPDRVAHLGKELQDFANNKFIEIKEAYNILMKLS